MDGLEQIVVKRNIPCVHILMSLDEIDAATPGYQFSKNKSAPWTNVGASNSSSNSNPNANRRKSHPRQGQKRDSNSTQSSNSRQQSKQQR